MLALSGYSNSLARPSEQGGGVREEGGGEREGCGVLKGEERGGGSGGKRGEVG